MDLNLDGPFESGFGLRLKQAMFLFAAVWTGSTLAGMCVLAGKLGESGKVDATDLHDFAGSFNLILSAWLAPNSLLIGLLCSGLVLFPDVVAGLRTWAALVCAEAIFAMAAGMDMLEHRHVAMMIAWGCCSALLGMMGMGFRFIGQWQNNRWARELVQIQVVDGLEEGAP